MSSYSEGQVHQLADAFERAKFTPDDLTKLGQSRELLAQVRHLVRGTGKIGKVHHLIDCGAPPFITNGWNFQKNDQLPNRMRNWFRWDPTKIVLYVSRSQMDDVHADGERLKKNLAKKVVLPANVLDYLLEHPELIPEDWKQKEGCPRYIFFWGTQYLDSDGDRFVRCLWWDKDQWVGHYNYIDDSWPSNYCTAVLVEQ